MRGANGVNTFSDIFFISHDAVPTRALNEKCTIIGNICYCYLDNDPALLLGLLPMLLLLLEFFLKKGIAKVIDRY